MASKIRKGFRLLVRPIHQGLKMKTLIKIIFSICLAGTFLWAEEPEASSKYLHISTNPSGGDAYLGEIHPDFASQPDYFLPAFIEVPAGESQILVTLFRPDFRDTTINVRLSDKDTSYLRVSYTPIDDVEIMEERESILARRSRRAFGHRLIIASAVPLIASGISALIATYEIDKANNKKKSIESSFIQNKKEISDKLKDYNDYRDKAKTARTATFSTLIAGGIILSAGIILSF